MVKRTRRTGIVVSLFIVLIVVSVMGGCTSLSAIQDINENPGHLMRGDPENTNRVVEYLEMALADQEHREVRAYNRRAFSTENKKTLFRYHNYFGFYHEGELEHTLVFTATPKGSEMKGNWMLDADSDIESLQMFLDGDNPWEVEEYVDKQGNATLHFENTVKKILDRIDAGYTFFGPASVRNLPWYHWLWVSLTPPPIVTMGTVLIMSINTDNCVSAVLETMQWK